MVNDVYTTGVFPASYWSTVLRGPAKFKEFLDCRAITFPDLLFRQVVQVVPYSLIISSCTSRHASSEPA